MSFFKWLHINQHVPSLKVEITNAFSINIARWQSSSGVIFVNETTCDETLKIVYSTYIKAYWVIKASITIVVKALEAKQVESQL